MLIFNNKTHSWLKKLGLTNKHYKALWPICESWKDEAKNPFSDSRTVSGNPGVQETLNCTKLAHGLGRKWDLPQIKWKFDMHFNWTATHLLVLPPPFCLCIIASLPGIKYDNLINPQARLRYFRLQIVDLRSKMFWPPVSDHSILHHHHHPQVNMLRHHHLNENHHLPNNPWPIIS